MHQIDPEYYLFDSSAAPTLTVVMQCAAHKCSVHFIYIPISFNVKRPAGDVTERSSHLCEKPTEQQLQLLWP
ncbi:hypothetical protein F2P81_018242 [Scophthalmus maximus]|uniref:Uncharacterized protein n=1 Tax=Scophthalmus maximus TaxID=52904 RepID=A0A6A4S7P2_SCOMX|nr:hypothetical protein F2P81_018242 [Scophthalmus maximus]